MTKTDQKENMAGYLKTVSAGTSWGLITGFGLGVSISAHAYYSDYMQVSTSSALAVSLYAGLAYAIFLAPAGALAAAVLTYLYRKFSLPFYPVFATPFLILYLFLISYCAYICAVSTPGYAVTMTGMTILWLVLALPPVMVWLLLLKKRLFHLAAIAVMALIILVQVPIQDLMARPALFGHELPPQLSELRRSIISRTRPTNEHILFVGLDGLSWHVMRPMMAEGELPVLKKLMEQGVYGEMETIIPTASPIIWNTVSTGMPPGKHGISSWTEMDFPGWGPGETFHQPLGVGLSKVLSITGIHRPDVDTPNAYDRRRPALWDILSMVEMPVAVVNWWNTYPVYPISGVMVSNHLYFFRENIDRKDQGPEDTDDSQVVFPPSLDREYRSHITAPSSLIVSDYNQFMNIEEEDFRLMQALQDYEKYDVRGEFKHILAMDRTYFGIAESVMENQPTPYKLAMLYFRGVDCISHCAMRYSPVANDRSVPAEDKDKYGKALQEFYRYSDRELGKLLEDASENATVIVMSDHGFEKENNGLWNHNEAPASVFIMKGPAVVQGMELGRHSVYDVAPTVLYLMGLPVAEDMPGEVIEEALLPDWRSSHKLATIPTYGRWSLTPGEFSSAGDERAKSEMMDRLRALGYIQ